MNRGKPGEKRTRRPQETIEEKIARELNEKQKMQISQ